MSDYTPLEEETILEYWQRKQIDTENQLQQELVEHAKTKTQLRTLTSENQELSRQLAEANQRYHRDVEEPGQAVADVEKLEHELMVANASAQFNSEYARAFELQRDKLRAEVEELQGWKQSQLTVDKWWHRVDRFIREHPESIAGQSVADEVLKRLRQRDDYKHELTCVKTTFEKLLNVPIFPTP